MFLCRKVVGEFSIDLLACTYRNDQENNIEPASQILAAPFQIKYQSSWKYASVAFFDVFIRHRHILWHRLKTGAARKTIRKALPFVSSHIKDNAEVIHFQIKSRGVQGLVFVQKLLKNISRISILKTVKLLSKQQSPICSPY